MPLPGSGQKEVILVEPMDDGGMGSLRIFENGVPDLDAGFGDEVSVLQFFDADKILVTAALNVDAAGRLYELDVWKIDFTPLLMIPEKLE